MTARDRRRRTRDRRRRSSRWTNGTVVTVFLRDAEQAGDGHQRQIDRHMLDEVASPLGGRVLAMFCARSSSASSNRHGLWREPREMSLRSRVCSGASLLSSCAASRPPRGSSPSARRDRTVLLAGEDVVVLRHLLDVLVLGDDPIAVVVEATAALGHLVPRTARSCGVPRIPTGQTGEVDVGSRKSKSSGTLVGPCFIPPGPTIVCIHIDTTCSSSISDRDCDH